MLAGSVRKLWLQISLPAMLIIGQRDRERERVIEGERE